MIVTELFLKGGKTNYRNLNVHGDEADILSSIDELEHDGDNYDADDEDYKETIARASKSLIGKLIDSALVGRRSVLSDKSTTIEEQKKLKTLNNVVKSLKHIAALHYRDSHNERVSLMFYFLKLSFSLSSQPLR